MLYRNHLICRVAFILSVLSGASSNVSQAADRYWIDPLGGPFNTTTNWSTFSGGPDGASVPVAGDTAIFDIDTGGSFYPVTFSANAASDVIRVTDGSVFLRSDSATVRTYNVTTGAADLVARGGLIQVGGVGTPIDLNVADQLDIGDSSASGTVLVVGSGSRLDATSIVSQFIGLNGFTGALRFHSSSLGTITGPLNLAVSSVDTSQGHLEVSTGADLTLSTLNIATMNSDASADVTVDGTGSTLTQTGAATLNVGAAIGPAGSALINVTNNGVFTTGTGGTTIQYSGKIDINGGTFNANGDVLLIDGALHRSASTFNLATGKSLTAETFAEVVFTGSYNINNATTFNIRSNADLSTTSYLDVGNGSSGTLLVETSGSFVTTGNDFSFWGSGGATGNITIRNLATATLGSISLAQGDVANTVGIWNVESGAHVTAGSIFIASSGPTGGSGTMTVTGSGTTLLQNGASTLTVGHATAGTATLTVADNGAFSTGTGQTTVNATGTINLNGGTFVADGNLLLNGGTLNRAGGSFVLSAGKTLTAQNNAQVNILGTSYSLNNNTTFTIDSGSDLSANNSVFVGRVSKGTLVVDGVGSSLTTHPGVVTYWGSDGGVANITIRNSAMADLGIIDLAASNSVATWSIESNADVTVRSIQIASGGTPGSSGILAVYGTGSTLTQGGTSTLTVGAAFNSPGTLHIYDGGSFTTGTGLTKVNATGTVEVAGGMLILNGPVSGTGRFNFTIGQLHVNDATQSVGFGPTNLRIGGLATAMLPELDSSKQLNVAGTAIVEPGGHLSVVGADVSFGNLVLASGGRLTYQAGAINSGAVQAAAGSVLDLQANVALGDAGALNGVFVEGTLSVHDNTVTLLDANDAVFDSGALVTIGNAAAGTLAAANGITLDFGGNFTGFGAIDTPNDPTRPLINNGHISGNSLAAPITLSGYVKGVGTCDNCNITGTDSPGFSPAAVSRGSVSYNGTLKIEIGGQTAGSEYDQLNHILGTGVAELGGTLEVSLISGFVPSLGDAFKILTAAGGVSGTFASTIFPNLGSSLALELLYDTNAVTLAVVPVLAGDYNNDGTVDAADYVLFRRHAGTSTVLANDPIGGVIGPAQYNQWRAHFGQSSAAGSFANTSVPEPSTYMLVTIAATGVWWRFAASRRSARCGAMAFV
jgi:T5SS/PEP-CTERM-associated repeat protein